MTWNLPKIREACRSFVHHDRYRDDWDPTKSLDDALLLRNVVLLELLLGGHAGYFKVIGTYPDGTTTDSEGFSPKDSVPLAICIVVLQCAGRDLKEFET